MGQSSIVCVEGSIRWYHGKSVKIKDTWVCATHKTVLELYDMELHQKISVPNYQKLKTHGKEEERSETSFTKLWREAWENWIWSRGLESKGNHWSWMRKRYLLPVERKRPVFARRPLQFPPTKPKIVRKNQNTPPPQSSEPVLARRRSVSRKRSIRGKSNHGSILRQPCRYYLKGTCTRTSCECWHPPECHHNWVCITRFRCTRFSR